jgi:hypothetical protein
LVLLHLLLVLPLWQVVPPWHPLLHLLLVQVQLLVLPLTFATTVEYVACLSYLAYQYLLSLECTLFDQLVLDLDLQVQRQF